MRKAQKDPQEWLTNLVKTMMRQLKVREKWPSLKDAEQIREALSVIIRYKLSEMAPATRGEIAEMCECYSPRNLLERSGAATVFSGRQIIIELALMVISSRMARILQKEASRGGMVVWEVER